MRWTPDCKYPLVYGEDGRTIIEIAMNEKNLDEFLAFVNTYFMNAKPNGENFTVCT